MISRLIALAALVMFLASSISTLQNSTYSAGYSSITREKVSAFAIDKSYDTCYCADVALINGTVLHFQKTPIKDRKITIYCDCVCDYSNVRNESNYYPGVNLSCSWRRNIGWRPLLSYDSSGKLVPYVYTNAWGGFSTIIYHFLNSNKTAPYDGTLYRFYSMDDLTKTRSPVVTYLAG